jgi:hypothetical protein
MGPVVPLSTALGSLEGRVTGFGGSTLSGSDADPYTQWALGSGSML